MYRKNCLQTKQKKQKNNIHIFFFDFELWHYRSMFHSKREKKSETIIQMKNTQQYIFLHYIWKYEFFFCLVRKQNRTKKFIFFVVFLFHQQIHSFTQPRKKNVFFWNYDQQKKTTTVMMWSKNNESCSYTQTKNHHEKKGFDDEMMVVVDDHKMFFFYWTKKICMM